MFKAIEVTNIGGQTVLNEKNLSRGEIGWGNMCEHMGVVGVSKIFHVVLLGCDPCN